MNREFWRYFWLNTRIVVWFAIIFGLIWSIFWSFQDHALNLWPCVFGLGLLFVCLVGTIIDFRKYNSRKK